MTTIPTFVLPPMRIFPHAYGLQNFTPECLKSQDCILIMTDQWSHNLRSISDLV